MAGLITHENIVTIFSKARGVDIETHARPTDAAMYCLRSWYPSEGWIDRIKEFRDELDRMIDEEILQQ